MDAVILQRPDHLQPGPVPHVYQPRILVPAKIPLQHAAVRRPVEHGPPGLELADPGRRLLRVELRHPPAVQILAAPHRVGEMRLPAVAVIDVRQRHSHSPLGHDRVCLA